MAFLLSLLAVLLSSSGSDAFLSPLVTHNAYRGAKVSARRIFGLQKNQQQGTGRHHRLKSLDTALEWLANERNQNKDGGESFYSKLEWVDITGTSENALDAMVVPLYPLGATYLPTNSTHYLNNIEPRNIKMALDLLELETKKFCVTLRATDSGRISRIGTIMELDDADIQKHEGEIRRIVLSCRPVSLVRIESILNPTAFSAENRLRKSSEYLKTAVSTVCTQTPTTTISDYNFSVLSQKVLKDYSTIQTLYDMGMGTETFLPPSREKLRDTLPELEPDDLTAATLWQTMELWQMLCNTMREGYRMAFSADRNEFLVAAAFRKGGPIKLPVHPEDLNPEDRRELQEMDSQASKRFFAMGMDPVLDFQVLLTIPSHEERLIFFSQMVEREKERLVKLSLSKSRLQANGGGQFFL